MESGYKVKENNSENDRKDFKTAETGKLENDLRVEKTTKANSETVAQNYMNKNEAVDVKATNTANGAEDVKVTVAHSENGAQNDKSRKTNAETGAQDVKVAESTNSPSISSISEENVRKTEIQSEIGGQDVKATKDKQANKPANANSENNASEGVKVIATQSEIGAQDVKATKDKQANKPTNANSEISASEGVKVTETHSEIGAQDVKATKNKQANKPTNANSENSASEGVKVTETHSEIGAQDVKATKDKQANKTTNANSGDVAAEDVRVPETRSGHSVQVVKVTESHTYELDEQALQEILMKEEIKDLPLVVVSIAGVTRSGKSFLLNFFLRYLKAPQSARDDGSWLGEQSAPLVGFEWSSGSKRTTLGILLWSEPFIITRPSGEKVAVFLLDTQGIFDNTSTVTDCSTIFALSTLISSVQIYNLSLNIQEDNLQYLQLFTDYGRMVKDQDSKAFQVLEFLVRDWQYPWEHPYGTAGGEDLLEEKLKILPTQTKEMQDLRKNIRSSFEKVSCFLMPHPGHEIFDPHHKGNISAIRKEFRTSMKDLATTLFSPEKLMPKTINGVQMKPRELFNYFKAYMTVFKSNEVPTLTTVYQAMVNANLMSIMNEASDVYKTGMESECGREQLCMPTDDLHVLHVKYSELARKTFTSKKTMGTKQDADKYLNQLIMELQRWLPQFEQGNLAKTQTLINKANESYKKGVEVFGKIETLCVHPLDVNIVHKAGLNAALKTFDEGRKRITTKEDDKRTEFIKNINSNQMTILEQLNQRNNDLAVSQVHIQYVKRMMTKIESNVIQSEEKFASEHNDEKRQAFEQLKAMRSKPMEGHTEEFPDTLLFEDVFEGKLMKAITNSFTELTELNNRKNRSAITAAVYEYDTYINKCLGDNFCCHPAFMQDTVLGGVRHVLEKYYPYELTRFDSQRLASSYNGETAHLKSYYNDCEEIIGNLIVRLLEKAVSLIDRNNYQNLSNEDKAFKLYVDTMYSEHHFWHFRSTIQRIHNETKEKAFEAFLNMRTDHIWSELKSETDDPVVNVMTGWNYDRFFESLAYKISRHYEENY